MNFKKYYLMEMIVIGTPKDNSYVIAFDKWIYILDKPNEEIFLKILNQLELIDKKNKINFNDINDFIRSISESVIDVLVGQIYNKNLYIYNFDAFKFDPKSSVLVNKVIKQLGLKSVIYTEDIDSSETKISKKKIEMKVPDVAYHGTTSELLDNIMKIGLRAGESESNYMDQEIEHYDIIFFTTRIGEAMHHAIHTANKKGGIPIIIEFIIPDKNLIISDYDIERLTNVIKYYDYISFKKDDYIKTYKKDPDKLSKEFGVYGYKGNIKPIFIKNIYVAIKPKNEIYNINTDFKKLKPKTALKYIKYYD